MSARKYTVAVWHDNAERVHDNVLAYTAEDARFQILLAYNEKEIGFVRVSPSEEPQEPEPFNASEISARRVRDGFCPDYVIELDVEHGRSLGEFAELIRALRPRRVLYDSANQRFTAGLLRDNYNLPMQPLAKPYRGQP